MDNFKSQIKTATGLMRRNAGAFMPRRGFLRLEIDGDIVAGTQRGRR